MRRAITILIGLMAVVYFTGCNTTKYLKPGEELYTGAVIKVEAKENVKNKEIKKSLEKVAFPKPNQTIFGIRFKLWFYYVAGEDPKKGIKKWLKYEAGEAPVLYDQQIPTRVSDIMVNRLNNLGYFDAQ